MKLRIKKHKHHKDDFVSEVNEIYKNSDHKTIAQQRQALIEVYSQCTADEAVLCERYRGLKYDAEYSLPVMLGMYLGAFASIFINYVSRFFDELETFNALFWTIVIGCSFIAIGFGFMWKLKRVYMKNKVLFLYPLEMKLLEDKLFQDTTYDTYEVAVTVLPDEPDATPESTDTPHPMPR